MEPTDLLATVPTSAAGMARSAQDAGLDTPVPSCPEWTVERLVDHTGKVLRFVGKVVETGGPVDARALPRPPAGSLVVQWFEEMAAATVAALATKDPDDQLWNWTGGPQVAGFWFRRMAHELAVHGADAVLAAGRRPELDPPLAADGIDELLTVLLPAKVSAGAADLGGFGSLHVHCTDTAGEWLVTPSAASATSATSVEVTRAHAKADAALRGPAADLLLRLCNRGQAGEVVGDAEVVAVFTERFRF